MKKTNAIRLLEKQQIPFESISYKYDPNNLDVRKIARDNAIPLEILYKTLIATDVHNNIVVGVIPGHKNLHLKSLAKASDSKKLVLLPQQDLLAKTGYVRGGCSPIGLKKNFPVIIDELAINENIIYINAGAKGQLISLSPSDLIAICNGVFASITSA